MDASIVILIVFALGLAMVNGGNDNLKGVATLLGSKVLSYRQGLTLASIATVAGSLASIFLAAGLLKAFSGKGLVPDDMTQSLLFITAVAGGAMITIAIATCITPDRDRSTPAALRSAFPRSARRSSTRPWSAQR